MMRRPPQLIDEFLHTYVAAVIGERALRIAGPVPWLLSLLCLLLASGPLFHTDRRAFFFVGALLWMVGGIPISVGVPIAIWRMISRRHHSVSDFLNARSRSPVLKFAAQFVAAAVAVLFALLGFGVLCCLVASALYFDRFITRFLAFLHH